MSFYRRRGKRMFDVMAAAALLVCACPVMVIVALCVRLTLGSPILFRQRRAGHCGRSFLLYKFRTMTEWHSENGEVASDSQRMTRLGGWLRSTSLDELPQLWNVLRGEMSLIGPRPLLPEYLPLYSQQELRRHDVLPGLTGWSQIKGRNSISWDAKLQHDLWYVRNISAYLDVKILALTVRTILSRRGVTADLHPTMPRLDLQRGREGFRDQAA